MEVVYGAHEFEAENQDEISFRIGERILVIEKDDQYHDGWWQVRDVLGYLLSTVLKANKCRTLQRQSI
jgi:hypothetical protein